MVRTFHKHTRCGFGGDSNPLNAQGAGIASELDSIGNNRPSNITEGDITRFKQSSSSKSVNADLLKQIKMDAKGNYSYDAPGSGQALDAFLAWKNKAEVNNADYQAYLEAAKGLPGRQGTVLTSPDKKTVLG